MIKKLLFTALLSGFFSLTAFSQFALGDIAFSTYHADISAGPPYDDYFTIVLLRDVTAGKKLNLLKMVGMQLGGLE